MKLDSKDYAPPDPAKIDADNPEWGPCSRR